MTTFKGRWYALGALALCTLAIGLDSTVLSVALPTLARDLGASTGDLQWFTSSYLINLPLVVLGLIAVAVLVPESYGDRRRGFDLPGVLLSAAGLVALTYGIIEAGERGWNDPRALLTIVLGGLALGALILWQRRAAAPLIDLDLFRNRAFTGGTLFATIAGFAFFGLLFALPQLFQAVGGADALGTGLRLLPVIGGLLVAARAADKLTARFGARAVIATGLAVMAAALLAGAATGPDTGYGYVAAWITVAGVGLGLTRPPPMNAALGALTPERSGVGSGLIQAMRQVGSAVGVAVLGTVLNTAYRDALPASAPDAVRESVAAARQSGDPALLAAAKEAFTHGLSVSLLAVGAVTAAGAVLALVVLPRTRQAAPVLAESGV